ncbi:MAG TPA: slipin family protein [Chitinophagaceae bacterium]|nr:slipin family protein [Chitinophagaceae bacterium]
MKKITINTNNVGIIFKNGMIKNVMTEGQYWISIFDQVEIFSMSNPFYPTIEMNILLQNDELKSLLQVIEVKDNSIAMLFINGLFKQILSTGKYLYWNGINEIKYQIIDFTNYEIDEAMDKNLLMRSELLNYVRAFPIDVFEKGLLFIEGEFVRILEPGLYKFWKNATAISIIKTDMRQLTMELNGQEILTKDKAQLRMNFTLQYKVTDIVKALIENKEFDKQLYLQVQLALREAVGRLTFDELMEAKDTISREVLERTKENAIKLGLEIATCGIKDIILSGEIKDIMNQVLIAEKRAQANTITRREETASTRSLLNTAKLMEENTMLFKLKEMEYVEKIAEKINNISLSGNGQIIDQLKTIFVKQ